MKRHLASACLVLIAVVILGANTAAANGNATRSSVVELRLSVVQIGSEVRVTIMNYSHVSTEIPRRVAVAGSGGGDLFLIGVNSIGQLAGPCEPADLLSEPGGSIRLAPGDSRVLWSGEKKWLAHWYCLDTGKYDAAFAFRARSGKLFFSNSFSLQITKRDLLTTR